MTYFMYFIWFGILTIYNTFDDPWNSVHSQQFSNFCSSDAEADIPVVGNVFSFVFTKYPPDWRWRFLKVNNFNFTVFSVVCFSNSWIKLDGIIFIWQSLKLTGQSEWMIEIIFGNHVGRYYLDCILKNIVKYLS